MSVAGLLQDDLFWGQHLTSSINLHNLGINFDMSINSKLSAVLIGDNRVGLTITELIGLVMDVASVPDVLNIGMLLICEMDGMIPRPMGIQ